MNLRQLSRIVSYLSIFALGLLLAACQNTSPDQPATVEPAPVQAEAEIECQEPRPEFCAQIYRPVCALRDTGIRCVTTPCDSTEWKTYSNGCSACGDEKVFGYNNGEC